MFPSFSVCSPISTRIIKGLLQTFGTDLRQKFSGEWLIKQPLRPEFRGAVPEITEREEVSVVLFNHLPNGRFFIFPTNGSGTCFENQAKSIFGVLAEFGLDELLARKFAGIENLRDLPMVYQDHGFSGNRLKL